MTLSSRRLPLIRVSVFVCLMMPVLRAAPPADSVEFFEQRIRPVLIEHCYECHSVDTEQAGGLVLDSKLGWEQGGDSGPAVVPGDAQASRLFRVVAAIDAELEMPPDGALPRQVVEDIKGWIEAGAVDPREDSTAPAKHQRDQIDWEAGRQHWAYRPVQSHQPPPLSPSVAGTMAAWPQHPIDHFILQRLTEQGLEPSGPAEPAALLRRVYHDLTGLPPAVETVRQFLAADDQAAAYERLVDRLIASPDFAEKFARHWLDVTRYAESVTLRGLVQSEAWRFRDYVIQSIDEDRAWKDVLVEHLAGDLLHLDSIEAQQRAQVAVTFLCMGNSNLENQQKRELEMDYIDEQLDTIGRALLGQTLGCARCHDHKFDPIPTSDYYAMAGILHGSVGLDHANVSRWIENPLPLPPEEQQQFDQWASELAQITKEITEINQQLKEGDSAQPKVVSASSLPGIIVDDVQARRVGYWKQSTSTKPYVDAGYVHDDNTGRGEKSLTFQPENLPPGRYEVRLAYCAAGGRTSRAHVTVFSADGEETLLVNQRQRPNVDGLWHSLGKFRFEAGGQAFVLLSNEGADGHLIGDAVQFLPLSDEEIAGAAPIVAEDPAVQAEQERLRQRRQELTSRQSQLQAQMATRPKAMGLRPRSDAGDLPIHIRGSIHSLGPTAPRGVLRILAGEDSRLEIAPDSCGRLEMAHWIADDQNPLTTRVLVNRIWLWVMGQGLVRTPDNFGTTGMPPTHPELLDWLAERFVAEGWSIKRLVKHIVMSSTYQQAATLPQRDDRRWEIDPDNRLWWRSDRKWVAAEAIRDSVLAISGELNPTRFGSRIRKGTNSDYAYEHDPYIRSVYLPVFRNSIPELLEAFNYTDPSYVTGQRGRAIVAQQALLILNHPWFSDRAAAAAQRNLAVNPHDRSQQIEYAFLQTLSRLPTTSELQSATAFVSSIQQLPRAEALEPGGKRVDEEGQQYALAQLYHGLFATAEFRQLD